MSKTEYFNNIIRYIIELLNRYFLSQDRHET